jgi:hypothetical protein
LTFNELHGVIFQKIELFITTAEGTSNHTNHYYFLKKNLPHKCGQKQILDT